MLVFPGSQSLISLMRGFLAALETFSLTPLSQLLSYLPQTSDNTRQKQETKHAFFSQFQFKCRMSFFKLNVSVSDSKSEIDLESSEMLLWLLEDLFVSIRSADFLAEFFAEGV